ncbi:MAG: hypothetical protein IPM47_11045 [Sphingobacteriales bacterium]|nr:MAG: hypothetical protein IPM47_11045 [Sphingobacteriales bacterium]
MKQFSTVASLILLFCCLISVQTIYAQCPAGQSEVSIVIDPDYYAASETDWTLHDMDDNLLASGSTSGVTLCLPNTTCLVFEITDTYGDGLYSSQGAGSYSVYYNGELIDTGVNFGYEAHVQFGGCPPGISCTFPEVAVTSVIYTALEPDTWYEFEPVENGQYAITTCFATCNTGIWVYDHCHGLHYNESQEGAISYTSTGCPNGTGDQALLYVNLFAGEHYFIRIGDDDTDCEGTPVQWGVMYMGPIVGCMDPTACNYEPLATQHIPSSCLYQPDANCPDGPDLIVLSNVLANSIYAQNKSNSSTCFVNEGCMAGYGTRRILRFTTHIRNIGNQDYYIGVPPSSPSTPDPQWEWDACHQHWHYEGYAEYILYNSAGVAMPVGFKNGFCVMDLECSGGGVAKFNCSNQGITAGCGDYYTHTLNCQWIDITNVPSGTYTLVVRTNWDQSPDKLGRHELNYNNNWAQVCIQITQGATSASVSVVSTCTPYTDCLGEIYGAAQPDCTGICNGPFKVGDLNNNFQLETNDVNSYLTGMIDGTMNFGTCRDANTDNNISLTDAILVNACVREQAELPHPGGEWRDFCSLATFNIYNFLEEAHFSIGAINPSLRYLDVYLLNPLTHVLGYQIQMGGIVIDNIESLVPDAGYNISFLHNDSGLLIGFSQDENILPRYLEPTPIFRVYYSELTDDEVCIENIVVAVNNNYEEIYAQVVDNCRFPYLTASIRIMLQGAYEPQLGFMRTDLSANGWLPETQPFSGAPWNYNGTESAADPQSMFPEITDWVLVELRNSEYPDVIADRRAALLRNDGMLMDVRGNVGVNFYNADPNSSYFIVVRSRNHVAIMSNGTHSIGNSPLIDLTNPGNVALGDWTLVNVGTPEIPMFAMYAGDLYANAVITVSDFNTYMSQQAELNGYYSADANLDGQITVQDFNLHAANAGIIGVNGVRY